MVDLAATLTQFQNAFENGLVEPESCELYNDLFVLQDNAGGKLRITYSKIVDGVVQGLVAYVLVEPYEGCPCFNVGYAVDPLYRNRGIGGTVLVESLAELQNGLGRHSGASYFVEAVVAVGNDPSNRLATKHLSSQPQRIVCQVSGEDAFQYLRRFPEEKNVKQDVTPNG